MKSIISLVAALVLGVALVGCNKLTTGTPVSKHEKGSAAIMGVAPSAGSYALYGTMDNSPKAVYILKEGDEIGFRAGEPGQVIAVAGDREVPLADGGYIWKKKND